MSNGTEFYKPLWLYRNGNHVYLKMEVSKGIWVEIFKEQIDGYFSHIIEPLGIEREIKKQTNHEQ